MNGWVRWLGVVIGVIDQILHKSEELMKAAVNSARIDFQAVRTGRANTGLVERIMVSYYDTPTPLNQMASISVPEPRLIVIQPWDKTQIPAIEKAILQSDLGLTPSNDGSVVRIAIPPLTEDRRKELVRYVRKEAEEKRIAVRNARREANEAIKALEKEVPEDERRKASDKVQELTDRYIKEIDRLLEAKEKEIMEV